MVASGAHPQLTRLLARYFHRRAVGLRDHHDPTTSLVAVGAMTVFRIARRLVINLAAPSVGSFKQETFGNFVRFNLRTSGTHSDTATTGTSFRHGQRFGIAPPLPILIVKK